MLYRAVQGAWAKVLAGFEQRERSLPRFCVREVDAFLRCGILAHGFARVWCEACAKDDVVAFSCKGRGFCPSCGARRMADTAAWLVDRVIPEVPVRQWVLSLPYRLRLLCAYDPDACALVRRVLVRAVSGFYEVQARRLGKPRPRTGAVAFVQRFDSGLRLNVHFHVLLLDGAYAWRPGRRAEWVEHDGLCDADVVRLGQRVRDRVVKALRRAGKWWGGEDVADGGDHLDEEQQLLLALGSGALTGRAVLGERAGVGDEHVGRGTRDEPFVKGPLCADCDGFSLHAGVRVAAGDRKRLEHLARYAGRPAIAGSRLELLPDGRVSYALKRRWKNGTTHVVMRPEVLIERLLALVPRPRRHLVTYHGVLAPAAGLRSQIVPAWREQNDEQGGAVVANDADVASAAGTRAIDSLRRQRRSVPHAPSKRRRGETRRYPWAELLRRVFELDVLVCPHCQGPRRLLAAIHDSASIEKVLRAMELPHEAPVLAPARAPSGAEGDWWGV